MLKNWIIILITCFAAATASGQNRKQALFIGNSYITSNNLPALTARVALSAGDTLIYDLHAPGGYTLQGHSQHPNTLSKISAGNWDAVVLQEQSQRPSFPDPTVEANVYPYARILDSLVGISNTCAETIFYQTWGRKNGDATNCSTAWPYVCSYEGMDSLLLLRYQTMANQNEGLVCAVGAVWHRIRELYPAIELYLSDGSHPSLAGSYAAACSFYTTIFRKNPLLITDNGGLQPAIALNIRETAREVITNQFLQWNIGKFDPSALFQIQSIDSDSISFINQSSYAEQYVWDFGDGQTATTINPHHRYLNSGDYTVTLTAIACERLSIHTKQVRIPENNEPAPISYPYPNPVGSTLRWIIDKPGGISVYNALGQRCLSDFSYDGNGIKLNVSALPAGVYIITAHYGDKKVSARFTKR